MGAIIPSISASSMMASRLDITHIFWDIDDFCNQWSRLWQKQKQLPSMPSEKRCRSRMSLSEVMTIVIEPKELLALPPAVF